MNKRFFSALNVPGYRWLLFNNFAMSAAWTADSMGNGWLVLQMTDSPFWVGLSVGVRGMAQFLFSALGGAIADRADRRKVLVTNALMSAGLALILAVLVFTDSVRVWHMLVYMGIAGLLGAVNGPTYNALAYDVVGPARLLNAVAFRFMVGGMVRIVAALTGGVLIDKLGLGPNYLFVTAGFLVSGFALFMVKAQARNLAKAVESPLRSLWSGFRYALKARPVRELLILSLVTEALGFSYLYMMPVMARDVLNVGATGLGYLTAASAAGQLLGAVVLASLGDFRAKGWLLVGSTVVFGLTIVAFALSPWFYVSLAVITIVGGSAGVYDSTMSTVLQMTAAGEMRGRVLGLYTSTWGSNQVGGFGLGALGTFLTVPVALALTGGMVAVYALRLVPMVRLITPAPVTEKGSDQPGSAPPSEPRVAQT